ncbi:uncharacterized protein Z520_04835 [Fonsecaea multimorphosa CBS 102226]|uniref:Cas1p 10 TM acyl transferase domain-containing protein n=1 Tax=Fonsecaea multimorphosa CBS 102226 TaxID=1442371 RepID=A0A0D2K7W6_9EURO|nr:uncharacterized protein Z520_04835 [Fonsecaea multimorphosa CBS 102226]KIX99259.1 hypothetical protein Z520_04835 [Fonsecaea multimorphosa CBS 102226]OAL25950.1 hypothetical protein AYO22_04577 [Fonsecaea multimorphosa]
MLHPYGSTKIQSCLSNQSLIFFGGTKARQIFWTVAEKLDLQGAQIASQKPETNITGATIFNSKGAGIIHVWDPAFNSTRHALVGIRPIEKNYTPAGYPWMIDDTHFFFNEDGIHLTNEAAPLHADAVLNYFCNKLVDVPSKSSQAYCCAPYVGPNGVQKMLLLMSSCAIVYHLLSFFACSKRIFNHERGWLSFPETARVAGAVATISLAVLYCYMADRTALFEKATKAAELGTFLCMTGIALLAGLATFKQNRVQHETTNGNMTALPEYRQVLSRQQTEEWKGWMQIIILLYHYLGLSKVLWVYQFVRLLVSSYLFMTGFGHTTYFITTNDFSFRRVATVLLRTNLLNIILAFVMGTRYDLYYFPMLTSLWFLIVWATVPRNAAPGVDMYRFVRRTAISFTLVRLTLGASDIIEPFFAVLGDAGLGLPGIDGRELFFRFGLDAYIAFIGMITAVLYAKYDTCYGLQCHKIAAVAIPWFQPTSRLTTWGATVVVLAYSIFCGCFTDKFRYNEWHPLLSPLPVLAFIALRNSTRKLSASHSRLFAWFGRCSLETFVFQYHILLAADSRGVLRPRLACKLLGRQGCRGVFDILETAIVVAAFLWTSAATTNALSIITKSLAGLGPKALFVFVGVWILNLAWIPAAATTA